MCFTLFGAALHKSKKKKKRIAEVAAAAEEEETEEEEEGDAKWSVRQIQQMFQRSLRRSHVKPAQLVTCLVNLLWKTVKQGIVLKSLNDIRMSAGDFQTKYSSVMESMLQGVIAETTKLFETMVDELKAEISRMKKENEDLKARCCQFESAGTRQSEPSPARSDRPGKRDTAVQCGEL